MEYSIFVFLSTYRSSSFLFYANFKKILYRKSSIIEKLSYCVIKKKSRITYAMKIKDNKDFYIKHFMF